MNSQRIVQSASFWIPSAQTSNDHNEGALGTLRVGKRHAPNTTLHQHNARTVCGINETEKYIEHTLDSVDHAFFRKRARLVDASGLEGRQRQVIDSNDSRDDSDGV